MNPSAFSSTTAGFKKPPLRVPPREKSALPSSSIGESTPLLRGLVYLYFVLLILEGAFRKWWLPQFSAPLLIVRDPIILLIFLQAHQQKIVPRHHLFGMFIFQAVAGILLVISQYVVLSLPPFVLFYGYRTLFLHFPLVFLLPHIFSRADLLRLGKIVVLAAIPMAALMTYQFNSSPESWINKTVGVGGGVQIQSAMGKIRPPGTFSFITGPVAFFALVTAFVGYGLVSRERSLPKWLLVAGIVSVGLAVAVSGSRAAILSGAIVVVAWLMGAIASRGMSDRMGQSLIIVVLAIFVLGQLESFKEGTEVLKERAEVSAQFEEASGGLLGRYLRELIGPIKMLPDIPFFGAGLGVGTNVGANVLTGQMQFLMSEGEWGRVLLEMGPLFGLLFIWFRVALCWDLGKRSLQAARQGDLLPLLLFSACAINIFNGQIAQPTALGFTVLGAGLCAVALRYPPTEVAAELPPAPKQRRWPR